MDDDPNDAFLLQHAMKRVGVGNPIQVVNDGQEAIDYLQGAGRFADRIRFPFPCLVLLDLKLPHVMGLDVLKWIRQQPGMAVPVVLLTASREAADVATAYRLGANGFLVKPSQASQLEDMIKAIKDFWLTYNILPQGAALESPQTGGVSPAHSPRIGSAGHPMPPVNGKRRKMSPSSKTRS